jgi:hypothetical protein
VIFDISKNGWAGTDGALVDHFTSTPAVGPLVKKAG